MVCTRCGAYIFSTHSVFLYQNNIWWSECAKAYSKYLSIQFHSGFDIKKSIALTIYKMQHLPGMNLNWEIEREKQRSVGSQIEMVTTLIKIQNVLSTLSLAKVRKEQTIMKMSTTKKKTEKDVKREMNERTRKRKSLSPDRIKTQLYMHDKQAHSSSIHTMYNYIL